MVSPRAMVPITSPRGSRLIEALLLAATLRSRPSERCGAAGVVTGGGLGRLTSLAGGDAWALLLIAKLTSAVAAPAVWEGASAGGNASGEIGGATARLICPLRRIPMIGSAGPSETSVLRGAALTASRRAAFQTAWGTHSERSTITTLVCSGRKARRSDSRSAFAKATHPSVEKGGRAVTPGGTP